MFHCSVGLFVCCRCQCGKQQGDDGYDHTSRSYTLLYYGRFGQQNHLLRGPAILPPGVKSDTVAKLIRFRQTVVIQNTDTINTSTDSFPGSNHTVMQMVQSAHTHYNNTWLVQCCLQKPIMTFTIVAAFIMAKWKKRMMNMSLWRPD